MHGAPATSNTGFSDTYRYGKPYAFWVLTLLCLLMLFDILDRMVISSMAVSLKEHFQLSDGQFGGLMGIVNIAIAVMVFPSALIVDRWSRKKMVGIMALLWGCASLGCAFAPSYAVLFALRFMVGAGEAGYMPAASPLLLDAFPTNRHNTAMGLFNATAPIGSVLGILAGGFIADTFGWRHAFGIVAIPGIIVACMAFFLKEPARITLPANTSGKERISIWAVVKKLFKTRTLLCIYFSMAMSLIFTSCLMTWMPSFFVRGYGLPQKQAGVLAASVMAVMAIGAAIGGMVTDRFARKNPAAPLYCAAIFAFCNAFFFFLAFAVVPKNLTIPVMLMGALFTMAVSGPAFGSVMHASHAAIRATAVGLLVMVQNIFGMAIGAGLSGFLSDFYRKMFLSGSLGDVASLQASGAAEAVINNAALLFGLKSALITLAFTPLISAVLFFIAARAFNKDCADAECF